MKGMAGSGSFTSETSRYWIEASHERFRLRFRSPVAAARLLLTPSGRSELRFGLEGFLIMVQKHGGYSPHYVAGCRRWLRVAGHWRDYGGGQSDMWGSGPDLPHA